MAKTQVKKDVEMSAFEKDLLESVRQAKRGEGRVTHVPMTAAVEARLKVGVSQSAFAQLLGVSVRTLQEWEQGRREPSGAAKTLLRIAMRSPEAIRQAA
jgi:putative transcriptional regulator